ncbi:uncharacterized protein AB675_7427 [Cyphellophora attinorum]|uniref:Uncharacterized protein n=1 Tax=Cyphellophora attinorum TaxID=1664694 RepID=A0A0N1NXN1_9EURO|nr:uncharacterized protein AB675_7427 [Phialophora attinorum]KPI34323.1 hypothetical protein AB675_7427 [Phialophora attinorum]
MDAAKLSSALYQRAVNKCRRQHKFFFLSLPLPIRKLVYTALWLGNTVQVATWLKSHGEDFADRETCQLLLTCRQINKEAKPFYYYFSRWKFVSISTLNHFTWPTARWPPWSHITKVSLTKVNILEEFSKHLSKFRNLQLLTLDMPDEFRVRTPRRARDEGECRAFVRSLLTRRFYRNNFHEHLYIQRNWDVHLVIHVTYDTIDLETIHPKNSEVVLVDIDNHNVVYNWYRMPPPEKQYVAVMPSSGDSDVDCTIISDDEA